MVMVIICIFVYKCFENCVVIVIPKHQQVPDTVTASVLNGSNILSECLRVCIELHSSKNQQPSHTNIKVQSSNHTP